VVAVYPIRTASATGRTLLHGGASRRAPFP
jgi:hypothetical protein